MKQVRWRLPMRGWMSPDLCTFDFNHRLAKTFAFVQTYYAKPNGGLFEVLAAAGYASQPAGTFITNGCEDIRAAPSRSI